MSEFPIERARHLVDGTLLQRPLVNTCHRRDFLKIAGRENLVRCFEIIISQRCFHDIDARAAQETDDALACHAVEESSIGYWSENDAVLDHESIAIGEFRNIAKHVKHKAIVVSTLCRLH